MNYTFQFGDVLAQWPLLLYGVWITVLLAIGGIAGGTVLGTLMALASRAEVRALRSLARGYVHAIRNTPLLVQLYVVFFGLPSLGLHLTPFQAAIAALIVNNGAYMTEIVRAGIGGVHPSQLEAGAAIGLSGLQIVWYIVLVPALEKVFPALVSQSIILMLATSITSAIGADELTSAGGIIQSQTFRSFEVTIVVTVLYLLLTWLFRVGFRGLGWTLFPYRLGRAWAAR